MKSAHQLSFRTRLQQYSRGYLLLLCALLFLQLPLFSDRCGVDVQMIPGEIFTSFCRIPRNCPVLNGLFGFPLGFPRNFWQASLGFLVAVFVFCTDKPGSIEWLDSCHHELRIDDCFRGLAIVA